MNLDMVIELRRSVRRFDQEREVSEDLIKGLLLIAGRCPSAGAIRGFKGFITRENLAYDAPLCVVICTDPALYAKRYGDRGRDLYSIQDAAIYAAYLQLLLVDRGLASVWVGAFRESRIQQVIGTEMRPVAILAIGYEA